MQAMRNQARKQAATHRTTHTPCLLGDQRRPSKWKQCPRHATVQQGLTGGSEARVTRSAKVPAAGPGSDSGAAGSPGASVVAVGAVLLVLLSLVSGCSLMPLFGCTQGWLVPCVLLCFRRSRARWVVVAGWLGPRSCAPVLVLLVQARGPAFRLAVCLLGFPAVVCAVTPIPAIASLCNTARSVKKVLQENNKYVLETRYRAAITILAEAQPDTVTTSLSQNPLASQTNLSAVLSQNALTQSTPSSQLSLRRH